MEYQAFVRELARAGDVGAQRVAAAFVPPQHPASVVWEERTEMREQQAATERQPQLPALTIDEVRSCLQTIREKEMAWHDRAKHEREVALEVIEQPDDLREMLSLRREEIVAEVTEKTAFTEEEQARLKQWEAEKKSWNPLKRAAALEKEKMLLDAQRIRHERALYDAMLAFEMQEVSVHTERVNALDRTYDAYLRTSLALEKEVNDAWCVVNQRVPACEEQLIVIERAGGMSRIEGIGQDAKLGEIAEAVGQCYGSVPEATREEIEAQVRSEQRAFERLRDSMSMDR